jgi:hypothetical protein
MNVWILERGATFAELRVQREPGLDPVGHASEWIDPESAEWFATSSLLTARDPELAEPAETPASAVDYWFG